MTFAVFGEVGQGVFQGQQVFGVIIPVKKREAFVSIQVIERQSGRHAITLAELHDTEVDISNLVHITVTRSNCFYCVTCYFIFAQLSLRVQVRLKTGWSGVLSRSVQK